MNSIVIKIFSYTPITFLLIFQLFTQARSKASQVDTAPVPSALLQSSSEEKRKQTETTPTITVIYTPAETPRGQEIQGLMERTQSFEQLTAGLNQVLSLPEPLTLNQAECGMVNAYYSPADRQIVMCYELVDYFLALYTAEAEIDPNAPPPEISTVGALGFVMLHELGHALIDILDVPVLGKEEDAADQFATIILSMSDIGQVAAESTAVWFYTSAQQQDYANIPYWDEHSLDIQRFFNVICMLYGGSPETYGGLMQELGVSERRAELCQQEYFAAWETWKVVLAPHVTPLEQSQ
ncbi:DUF4344 domain-containing metallopeptidase [Oscillatoria sp. CS-180]|nr:DUF4344 domain-containing metallopeptidase [Oscillatoria sp. CS-180]MDB9527792.1 DUF4344 domain-containing metallopeptidase [Oscillatoria sp. CS-180]